MLKLDQADVGFFTVVEGPPKRRIWINAEHSPPPKQPSNWIPSWTIVCEELDINGVWRLHGDSIDDSFDRILKYPELYAPRTTQWIDLNTARPVNIYELKFGK